jgi:hypothetical protein
MVRHSDYATLEKQLEELESVETEEEPAERTPWEKMKAERDRLLRLLSHVEWVQPHSNSNPECSLCGGRQHNGHHEDCALDKALRGGEE